MPVYQCTMSAAVVTTTDAPLARASVTSAGSLARTIKGSGAPRGTASAAANSEAPASAPNAAAT